ncbi:MAG: hypothetical protein A2636_00315 [Elusimicrobia bacterium RIFCSPHIGHO2_01_FULL_64_10]|nr:MAG: hypothetical protein A2636_00315 [Elusimicrobia bacterium RIFCSPHIGHO2_01_FULL_64_10]
MSSRKKILVVDDDKEWSLLIRLRLEMAGFEAEQAFNGQEALDRIKAGRPELVLLDITMPVLSGWEVCQALRKQESTKDLPIVILSSYTQPEDIRQSKTYGVKRYLIKPCLPETVVQNVQDVLSQKG